MLELTRFINGMRSLFRSFLIDAGQRIFREGANYVAGEGTYKRNGFIYSSLAGFLHADETEEGKVQFVSLLIIIAAGFGRVA